MNSKTVTESGSLTLAQVADITLGFTPARKDESSGEKVRIIQVGDLVEETHSVRPQVELNEAMIPSGLSVGRYKVRAGDVLMSCKGTIGRLAVVDESVQGAAATSNLLILRPSSQMLPMALLAILKSSTTQNFLMSRARGATIQTVSFRDLEALAVPSLSKSSQEHLASLLEAHINLMRSIQQVELQRKNLVKGLIDQALWGKRP